MGKIKILHPQKHSIAYGMYTKLNNTKASHKSDSKTEEKASLQAAVPRNESMNRNLTHNRAIKHARSKHITSCTFERMSAYVPACKFEQLLQNLSL